MTIPEIQGEQEPAQADLGRYLSIARRRHVHFLIPFFCAWLVVWSASWVLQPRFKSSTLILVEQPTMPSNFVAPNVSDDLQDRLQSITQQILSRTRLLTIVQTLHLYSDKQGLAEDEQIERMRKDIDVELVRDTRNQQISAFRVSYTANNPHVAQQVTSQLTDLFINENNKVRKQESEGTTKFIETQLEAARTRLSEQEAKVQAFEAAHGGALPTQQASNLSILGGLQTQLQSEQDALNTARQQRVYLQSEIEQNRNQRGTRAADGSPTGLAAIDADLSKLRAQLADLSSRYTDQYPDVQKVKAQIAKMQQMREEMAANPERFAKETGAGHDVEAPNSPLGQLQSQLHANQLEIANKEAAITDLKKRIGDYQARLNQEPTTEQELAALTRGYDQSKADYDDLLKKRNQSEMATSMEEMQQGERFTMLDPPSLPAKPDFPNRLKFCGMGLVIGILLGAGVAAGAEFLDDRLHEEKDIKALLTMPVIAEIPVVVSPTDEHAAARRSKIKWAMTGAVAVTILAGAAISAMYH